MAIPTRAENSSLRLVEVGIGLAVLFLIAGGFVHSGGRGRLLELGAIAIAVLLGFVAGPSRAMLVAVPAAGALLALEAHYHRLDSSRAAAGAAYALGAAIVVLLSGRLRGGAARREQTARPEPGTLEYEFRRARRHAHPLSLLVVHPDGGGADLERLARRISETMRTTDFVAGLEEDDLWLLLPETSSEAARIAAERLRLAAGSDGRPVSVGVASFPEDGDSGELLAQSAGRALTRAIELGGNRTVLHTAPSDAPPGWGVMEPVAG